MKNFIFLISSVFLLSFGCVTVKPLSPLQRRALQVKSFESSYEHVFRAFKTVLQDEGYIIKNQDMQGGLIVAHATRTYSPGFFTTMAIVTRGDNVSYQTGTTYEVSVNLEEIQKGNVESRVIIQQVNSYNRGGLQGREIISPKLYKNIYSKVMVEIERRKLQGK